MSTSRLDQLASAAADELLNTAATGTDTVARRAELDRVRRNRRGVRLTAVAAVMASVLIVLLVEGNFFSNSNPQPMKPLPGIDVGDVPVWYDDAGLHRGNIVEQTPVELRQLDGMAIEDGALALVRNGALYLDPATGDVWFHPWGGDPRIVGQDSTTGPSGNPDGDIAAWFEGGHLVVYDTAADRVIARELPFWKVERAFGSNTCHAMCAEHAQPGNGFLLVSAERVIWNSSPSGEGHGPSNIYDVRTGQVSVADTKSVGRDEAELVDVSDDAAVYSVQDKSLWGWHLVLDVPGRAPQEYPEVNPRSRFSPSGNYLTSVGARAEGSGERVSAAIIDTRTGELWPVPETRYSWSAWSYGDIALVQQEDELLACDAALRTCETLPAEPPFLMPTN